MQAWYQSNSTQTEFHRKWITEERLVNYEKSIIFCFYCTHFVVIIWLFSDYFQGGMEL